MSTQQQFNKSTAEIYKKISKSIPEIEWKIHAPLIEKINRLKVEKNAVILAHNYQTPEIYHGVADISADSLALAMEAAKTSANIIVLCGVHFMAETAKLMNPSKKVLLPDMSAGCSLSASITGDDVRLLKQKYPGVPVVSYINTSADVKAETDICCTSANAVKVVESLNVDKVIFLPDQYLANYVASNTNVKIISWKGTCVVHEKFTAKEVEEVRAANPGIKIIAHPESEEHILKTATYVGSTSGMINYVKQHANEKFIVATEAGILHKMQEEVPNTELIPAPAKEDNTCACSECAYMKVNTMQKLYDCLLNEYPKIDVAKDIRKKALLPINRMLELSK